MCSHAGKADKDLFAGKDLKDDVWSSISVKEATKEATAGGTAQ
jgi:hypothetical protein